MCGRVATVSPAEKLQRQFKLRAVLAAPDRPLYNVAPSLPVPVVANTAERELDLYRWGFIRPDAPLMFNARIESLATRPLFRRALIERRCVVLVDAFYEWRREGKLRRPFAFRRRDGLAFALAALWDESRPGGTGEVIRSCTIVTTTANALLAPVHDRMPVILSSECFDRWLAPKPGEPGELTALLRSTPPDELESYEVSSAVNASTREGPELLTPLSASERELGQQKLLL